MGIAGKIAKIMNLAGNMGWRYMSFRARYEVMRRSGSLKKKFPTAPRYQQYVTLKEWQQQPVSFFFASKSALSFPKRPDTALKERFEQLKNGKFLLFNSITADLGKDDDWVTNPDSGYKYDVNKHWTEIADYSKEAGDIKFVWERSRFSYIYDILRYDHHFNEDHGKMVFADIASWIDNNPVNCGPNYRCSQEMSLRVLNWTFALHYYSNSPDLTEDIFNKMQYAIYWHMHHVYHNINFSRIAVRNNHAITETLALYLAGLLYPTLPDAALWKKKGKAWFEEEIAYQVYDDGTFLQYSMNYHRIVVQLLTWGIVLADLNKERFSDIVYQRAKRSFTFLRTCMVDENGYLPNYGANDGALFFKLSNAEYRDYRPQLQALALALGTELQFNDHNEDAHWYGIFENARKMWKPENGIYSFAKGGYYIAREKNTLTFIKCGGYKDRPQQADNLHLDIWYKGVNILPDGGSYKYNTDSATIKYFSGTASHNSVMLDDKDQMLKGGHFIWYYWSQCVHAELKEQNDSYRFEGAISAFTYIANGIQHKRTVLKKKDIAEWIVTDEIMNKPPAMQMRQLWHILPEAMKQVNITAKDGDGRELKATQQDGWQSSKYGEKGPTKEYIYSSAGNTIYTVIKAG